MDPKDFSVPSEAGTKTYPRKGEGIGNIEVRGKVFPEARGIIDGEDVKVIITSEGRKTI